MGHHAIQRQLSPAVHALHPCASAGSHKPLAFPSPPPSLLSPCRMQAVGYGVFSLAAVLSVVAAAAAAADWPAMAGPALGLLLPLTVAVWALAAGLTLVLRWGIDACAAPEQLLSSLAGDNPLLSFYFECAPSGTGSSVLPLLSASFGLGDLDVAAAVGAADAALAGLGAALHGWPAPASAALVPAMGAAEAQLAALADGLGALEAAASHQTVHAVRIPALPVPFHCSHCPARGMHEHFRSTLPHALRRSMPRPNPSCAAPRSTRRARCGPRCSWPAARRWRCCCWPACGWAGWTGWGAALAAATSIP